MLYKKLNYDPAKDFVPIYLYVKSPFVLVVNPDLPAKTVPELIQYAKASANPLPYSTPGVGVMQHLSMEFMVQRYGLKMTHVPYRNTRSRSPTSRPATSMLGFAEAGASLPLIREGKVRALAVSSSTRLPTCPRCRRSAKRRARRTSKPCRGTCCSGPAARRRRSSTACTTR